MTRKGGPRLGADHRVRWSPVARRNTKEEAIALNYEAFEAMLPLLLQEHEGQYVLLRDGAVVSFYDKASDAQLAGKREFADVRFSVQKVEKKAIDLGFYSYARYRRVA
jgi:hypothetical protein